MIFSMMSMCGYAHVCVCEYVCMQTFVCAFAVCMYYMYVCVCMCARILVCMPIPMCVSVYVYVRWPYWSRHAMINMSHELCDYRH